MTRFREKLFRFPTAVAIVKTKTKPPAATATETALGLLPLKKITDLSASAYNLCKKFLARIFVSPFMSYFSKSPAFSDDDADFSWGSDSRSHLNGLKRKSPFDEDENDLAIDKVYLVPYSWWKEAHVDAHKEEHRVLSVATSNSEDEWEIVLKLTKATFQEDYGNSEEDLESEAGFSGCQYALVPEGKWLLALKRHNGLNSTVTCSHPPSVFPLQIRILKSPGTSSLIVRITQKDNGIEFYRNAHKIFCSGSKQMHIWDFSEQTMQLFTNGGVNFDDDSPGQPSNEILLELHVHGLPDYMSRRDGKLRITADVPQMEGSSNRSSGMLNGSTGTVNPLVTQMKSQYNTSHGVSCSMGLTGLYNLGNTCFMNSAIQCLAHTTEIVDFFLGDYRKEINYENPLGMKGELALAFGDLLKKLWTPEAGPVAPKLFKTKLAHFAPQFSGYNQHDSQELLAFLLDGLHEDLNRVKQKPYNEIKDAEGREDEEVAEEYWQNHLARNDSIIVELCQGQFRSTLVCPACNKVSITFDPFMYLSLPLPSTTVRSMTLTVLNTDGVTLPVTFTVTVPKSGRLQDLINATSAACGLRDGECLLMTEVFQNKIVGWLNDLSDSLGLIRDGDRLVAYRLQKDCKMLVVYENQRKETIRQQFTGRLRTSKSTFGIPLVAKISGIPSEDDIRREFLKLINPFLRPTEVLVNGNVMDDNSYEDMQMDDASSAAALDTGGDSSSGTGIDKVGAPEFEFEFDFSPPELNELSVSEIPKKLNVTVLWSDKMIEAYDISYLKSLPEVFDCQSLAKRPQESVSLYECLEAFLTKEPLGPDDMWYCPSCRKPQQASKKLDLWRLPEVLVIHLKRFSFSRYLKNKLETFVDFPIDDLDFSPYLVHKKSQSSTRYKLYAVSCHYGGLGGGHYTAFIGETRDSWWEFDDSRVFPVDPEMIKTSAAYVLFYKRVDEMKS